jgi:signal transduction histidine kinase
MCDVSVLIETLCAKNAMSPDTPQIQLDSCPDLSTHVLDSLTAAVAVVNRQGIIRATNEAWRKFAIENGGLPNATGVGANYFDVCRRAQGQDSVLAARAAAGISQVLEGQRDAFSLEYPCHSPFKKRWFLLHVSPLKDDSEHVVTTHLAITERKLVEQELLKTERLAAIGEAMQGLSHEGRNALQRAQGCIDLLRCHIEQDTEAVELLERINRAQRKLIGLYEEVKNYAAPIALQQKPYPLNELVQEVWGTFASHSPQLQFSQLPSTNDLTCDIDVLAIGQVFQSLFENCIATETPSLIIEVSYSLAELDGAAAITAIVSDNGPGIPEADWERVFEPFYTTKTHGTGLGLAACKRLAEAHRGRIKVGTPLCGGASVYLTLPR